MLGFPKGPMQIEEDLAQIRHDMSNVGVIVIEMMDELKKIRRMMAVHLGEATAGDIQEEIEDEQEAIQKIKEERGLV